MADDDKTTARKSKERSNDIELLSEKVRNIIGQIPPFLIRSGIGVIAIVMILALAVCYFIPYYETAEGQVTLFSIPESEVYYAPVQGKVYFSPHLEEDRVSVSRGDTIGYLVPHNSLITDIPGLSGKTSSNDFNVSHAALLPTDSIITLVARIAGRLSLNMKKGEKVSNGEILFAIIPDSITSVYGQVILPYGYKEKIREGQQVRIKPAGFPSNEYGVLQGSIDKIYPLAIGKGHNFAFLDGIIGSDFEQSNHMFLKADVVLFDGLTTSHQKELPFIPEMQGKASIIISKRSLLMKLFKF